MIELNAPTLTAPDIFSLIPTLETAGPVESVNPSAPIEQDFSALLTELIGPVETPAPPAPLQIVEAVQVREVSDGSVSDPLPPFLRLRPVGLALRAAALPLFKGENGENGENVIVPLSEGDGREAAGGRSHVGLPIEHSDPKKVEEVEPLTVLVPFVGIVPDGTVSDPLPPPADGIVPLTEGDGREAAGGRSHVGLPIEHWADVQKFEFKVRQEAGQPAEARPQPQPQTRPAPAPAPVEALKLAMVTSDPIANTQQQQLPPRVTAIQKVTIEARLPERGPKSETAPPSNGTILAPAVHFSDVASASGGAPPVEQARPAHHVEIPNAPHVQVVRTVAMEVGDADSQVVIRIQERGGNVSLQLDAASEPMRHNLQSTVGSLVQALRREDVQVSSVEVSRKSPIEKVRRMKEAH